ncbi:MAG: NUDIX domain-containing protein [Balneolaceae bacterium]
MSLKAYTGKTRVRSCGLLIEENKILLVKLKSPVKNKEVWLAPGGGVAFGETLSETLLREFEEETGLKISVEKLVHINELIEPPFHAIEFYFLVNRTTGKMSLGTDPEHSDQEQILQKLQFFSQEEIRSIEVAPDYLKNELWVQKSAGFKAIEVYQV